jgi:hypothetical protein
MKMYPLRSCLVATLVVLWGCSVETSVTPPNGDTSVADSATGDGSPDAMPDGSLDSTVSDSSLMDGAVDSGDTSIGDSAVVDGATDAVADAAMDADGATDAVADAADAAMDADGAADTGPPDTGPADTGTPDTGTIVSCDDAYSSSRNYFLCDMGTDRCEFYVDPSGDDSCDNVCAAGGGTCLDTYSESGDTGTSRCSRSSSRSCSASSNDFICICSRPVI